MRADLAADYLVTGTRALKLLDERLILTFIGDGVKIDAGYYPKEPLDTPPHLPPEDTVYFSNLAKIIPIDDLLNETLSLLEKTTESLQKVVEFLQGDIDLSPDSSADEMREVRALICRGTSDRLVTWAMTDALIDFCFSNDGRGLTYQRVDQMLSFFSERPRREVILVGDDGELSPRNYSGLLEYEIDEGYWKEYWRTWKLEENETLAHRFMCGSLFQVCLASVEYTALEEIELRRCQYCGKVYFKKRGYSYRYCSKTCHGKHEAERVRRYRESDVNREIGQIRSILNGRKEWDAEEDFDIFLFKLRGSRRAGSITDEQMLDELKKYHESIKRRK